MGLRVVLVGLVASLGLDLPSGQEVGAWVNSGKAWCLAIVADEDARMPNGRAAFAEARPEPAQVVAEAPNDGAFRNAVEAMVAQVKEERTVVAVASRPVVFRATEAVEGPEFGDALARALNRSDEPESAFEPTAVAEVVPAASSGPSRVERLVLAVRLTRQAAGAWMSLLERPEAVALGH